ncbi:MAG TPA: DUF2497 domain-containing protein [Xanthobacteraceae bacterium]|nr:DUF2497 domain-containing protein [Xanthobacteraceae bacterium]
MSQPAKAPEPSMEEILASIRRIIADDDATKEAPKAAPRPPEPSSVKAAPAPPPAAEPVTQDDIDAVLAGLDEAPAEPAPDPNEDVLELTEAMEAPPPEPPQPPQPAFRRIEPTQDVVFDEPPPRPARSPEPEAALLSSAASAAIHSAFGNLAHSMLVQNSRTLEDLVKEMLRPMLKAWLDDNLPMMVERLVRAEIERVSRGPKA